MRVGLARLLHAKPLRRFAVALNICVAIVGLGFVIYPFATDAWTSRVVQPAAARRLADPAYAARFRAGVLDTADPVTRLRIPRLGIDIVVVQGVTPRALRAGAGHYPNTPLPGSSGNVAIAGHRTTFGKPFRHLDDLRRGDTIELITPVGRYTYRLSRDPYVVSPTDLTVLRQDQRAMLTLTTCEPVHSARQRLIVQAVLV